MKIIKGIKITIALGAMCFAGSTWAYNAGNTSERCVEPVFRDFIPAEHKRGEPVPEVEAESVVGFSVHRKPDPTTIRAEVRDIKLKLDVEHRNIFSIVKIKLPPELNGKYARINLYAIAQKGECKSKDGWLIKVKDAVPVAEAAVEEETAE